MRHGNGTGIMVQTVGDLVGIRISVPNGGAACAGTCGVACLDQKALDHPVEGQAVVIALLGQTDKIFHSHGSDIRVQYKRNIAQRCGERSDGVAFGGRDELELAKVCGTGALARGGSEAPAFAGAQQHAARGCGTKGDKDTFGQGCFPLCGGIRAQTPGYRIKIKECFLRSAALRGSVNGACRPQRKARSRHVRAGFGFEIILSQTRRERSE